MRCLQYSLYNGLPVALVVSPIQFRLYCLYLYCWDITMAVQERLKEVLLLLEVVISYNFIVWVTIYDEKLPIKYVQCVIIENFILFSLFNIENIRYFYGNLHSLIYSSIHHIWKFIVVIISYKFLCHPSFLPLHLSVMKTIKFMIYP